MDGNELPILFSGHSLGGALTQIAALDLTSSGKCKIDSTKIVTFGSPRVFSKEAARQYIQSGLAKVTLLIRQARDIVPSTSKAFYAHWGFKMKIPNESVTAHGGISYRNGAKKVEIQETGKIYSIRETEIMKEPMKKVSLNEYVTTIMSLTKEKLKNIFKSQPTEKIINLFSKKQTTQGPAPVTRGNGKSAGLSI